ncbi:MAG: hypothetical protein QXU18_03630 [Thermoplasmatales archaeon]
MKDLTNSERKKTRNRGAVAVYSKEKEIDNISHLDEKVFTVRPIISSGMKGSDLLHALGKLKSYTKNNETEINEEKIKIMKGLAGRFMIVSDTDLSANEIVKITRISWKIERSFCTIRSLLEVRPVFHRKEKKIGAHVLHTSSHCLYRGCLRRHLTMR